MALPCSAVAIDWKILLYLLINIHISINIRFINFMSLQSYTITEHDIHFRPMPSRWITHLENYIATTFTWESWRQEDPHSSRRDWRQLMQSAFQYTLYILDIRLRLVNGHLPVQSVSTRTHFVCLAAASLTEIVQILHKPPSFRLLATRYNAVPGWTATFAGSNRL